MNDVALAVRDCEVWRYSGIEVRAAQHGDLAETPNIGIGDDRLSHFSREASKVEPLGFFQIFGQWNADVGAARALRLHFEFVDARQIGGAHPEIVALDARLIQFGDAVLIEHGGCRARDWSTESCCCAGGGEHKLPPIHCWDHY